MPEGQQDHGGVVFGSRPRATVPFTVVEVLAFDVAFIGQTPLLGRLLFLS
jgi:hypothetical protein